MYTSRKFVHNINSTQEITDYLLALLEQSPIYEREITTTVLQKTASAVRIDK